MASWSYVYNAVTAMLPELFEEVVTSRVVKSYERFEYMRLFGPGKVEFRLG
jgi:hypothetical protein